MGQETQSYKSKVESSSSSLPFTSLALPCINECRECQPDGAPWQPNQEQKPPMAAYAQPLRQ